MGQFKPMVKMMTTEPSVELKLKKGGSVKKMTKMNHGGESGHKKMANGGGAMGAIMGTPALVGRPAVNAPVRTPGKPSMAARRKAMAARPAMKGGGESKKEHKAEMSKMKGLEKELESHESKPASKGHKGLKTGGVAMGNAGGYKKGGKVKMAKGGAYCADGGIINTENQGGAYRNTKMHTAEYTGKNSGKTGGVKDGNAGGYKTGGVALGNAGGYKKGGMPMKNGKPAFLAKGMGGKATKKAYAAGGTVDSGSPVAMPQGRKKPSTPVSINQLSGTFKKGGSVTPAQGRLMKNFAAENKTAMKQAKAQSNEVYSKYQKMADGGITDREAEIFSRLGRLMPEEMMEGAPTEREAEIYRSLKPQEMVPRKFPFEEMQKMPRQYQEKMESLKDSMRKLPNRFDEKETLEDLMQKMPKFPRAKKMGQGAITETERSVTVAPAKKRGGRAC